MPAPTPPPFEGFAGVRFFRDLAKHQSRDWFLEHKAEYDEGFAAPMASLLAEVARKLDGAYPDCDLGEPKVFRIQRDVRFSADKSPYKTHVSGIVPCKLGSAKATEAPTVLYLQLGVGPVEGGRAGALEEQRFAGAGLWMMDPVRLARFRAAVLDDTKGKELAAIVAKLEKKGFSMAAHDALKKVPRGMDPEHPRADLLRRKGLAPMFPAMPSELPTTRELADWLVAQGRLVAPLVRWLVRATA